MLFKKRPKDGARAIDKMVTWIILGGVLASIYGIKKFEDHKKSHEELALRILEEQNKEKESKNPVVRFFDDLFN